MTASRSDPLALELSDVQFIKPLGSGSFGSAGMYKVTKPELAEELKRHGLCGDDGVIVIKKPIIKEGDPDWNEKIKNSMRHEAEVASALRNHCEQQGQLSSPAYNLAEGATLGGEPVILSKLEGNPEQAYCCGAIDDFIIGMRQINHPDLDILIVQLMNAKYASIEALHAAGVIHLDVANRNFLIALPRPEDFDENGELINLRVVVADYGLSHQLNGQERLQLTTIFIPLKYMDQDIVLHKIASKKSDLYSLKVSLFESLSHNFMYERFAQDPAERNAYIQRTPDHLRLADEYTELKNQKNMRSNSHLQRVHTTFQSYMSFVPGNGAQDKQILKESNTLFFKQALFDRLASVADNLNDKNQINQFMISIKRLLNIPVTDEFKNQNLYKLAEKLAASKDPEEQKKLIEQMQQEFVKKHTPLVGRWNEEMLQNALKAEHKEAFNRWNEQLKQFHLAANKPEKQRIRLRENAPSVSAPSIADKPPEQKQKPQLDPYQDVDKLAAQKQQNQATQDNPTNANISETQKQTVQQDNYQDTDQLAAQKQQSQTTQGNKKEKNGYVYVNENGKENVATEQDRRDKLRDSFNRHKNPVANTNENLTKMQLEQLQQQKAEKLAQEGNEKPKERIRLRGPK